MPCPLGAILIRSPPVPDPLPDYALVVFVVSVREVFGAIVGLRLDVTSESVGLLSNKFIVIDSSRTLWNSYSSTITIFPEGVKNTFSILPSGLGTPPAVPLCMRDDVLLRDCP